MFSYNVNVYAHFVKAKVGEVESQNDRELNILSSLFRVSLLTNATISFFVMRMCRANSTIPARR